MFRGVNNGFVLVKARVEQDGHASFGMEGADERVVPRGNILVNALQPSGPIDVGYRWDFGVPFDSDREYFFHKGNWFIQFKPIANVLG